MLKRLLGFLILLVGLGGLVLSGGGLVFGRQAIDQVAVNLENSLQTTADSLDTVINSLVLAQTTLTDVGTTLGTASDTTETVATAVQESRPLLTQINTIATDQVPQTLEEVQTAIPNIAQVAGVVDNTLTTLNNFRLDESLTIPIPFGPEINIPLQFDLGIDYTPTEPFDQTVNELGASLEGLPEQLRGLETYLTVTSSNLQTISQGLHDVADDMEAVNGRISEFAPLLDDYLLLATTTQTKLQNTQQQLNTQLDTLKLVLTVVTVWLALSQLVPLYVGWELVRGKSSVNSKQ